MKALVAAKDWARRTWRHPDTCALRAQAHHLFTEHPHETGETYLQHLWFTLRMSLRIAACATCLLIHGIFPFTFRKTTSAQIEKIYAILKKRIPKDRLEVIDQNWHI